MPTQQASQIGIILPLRLNVAIGLAFVALTILVTLGLVVVLLQTLAHSV